LGSASPSFVRTGCKVKLNDIARGIAHFKLGNDGTLVIQLTAIEFDAYCTQLFGHAFEIITGERHVIEVARA